MLVTLPSPYFKALACLFTFEVLRAKKHAPTPYSFVVFHFKLTFESIKELGSVSIAIGDGDGETI
jgi:hypothetical protein